MSNKVGGENFERAQSFQSLKSMWEAKVQESKRSEIGTVSHGKETPKQVEVDSVAVKEPRESKVLGEIPPPLGQDPMEGGQEPKSLTSSSSSVMVDESEIPEEGASLGTTQEGREVEVDREELQSSGPESRVKTQGESPPKVQDTAQETEHVAFNALERFVSIFSKSKAEKMQTKRLDGMVKNVDKHLKNGETDKAAKALVRLATVSPQKFEEKLQTLRTGMQQSMSVINEKGEKVEDNYTKTIHQLTKTIQGKYREHLNSGKLQEANKLFAILGKIPLSKKESREMAEFTRVEAYDDFTAREGPSDSRVMKSSDPMAMLSVNKHVQSIFRLPNKMDLIIRKGDNEKQLIWSKEKHGTAHEKDRETTTRDLFYGVNELLGRDMEDSDTNQDLDDKVSAYQDFNTKREDLNPFKDGKRVDGGKNEDILILKFVTKEMAGYALAPVAHQIREYCKENGLDEFEYSVPIRDQVEKCEVEIKPDNSGFTVKSEITLPIKKGDKVIGSIKVSLTAEVDSATGSAKVQVARSNLKFEEGVSTGVQREIFQILNAPLPQSQPA